MKVISCLAVLFVAVSGSPLISNSIDHSGYIVNGRDANIADFPHHLALIDQGRYFCGAAVISRLFALSAAHCLDINTPPELLNLWGGSTSRVSGGHLFFVREYHLHPQYRRIRLSTGQVIWDYDTAVLRVTDGTPLEGFPFVEPTILPPPCDSECCGVCSGTEISIAGWGRLANGSLPIYLQRLEQHVVPFSVCRNYWEGHITSRMFCVTADFYDSCDGDSGSAILTSPVHQVGYVSFGSMVCGDGSAPAVYGRLEEPSIRNFIRQITGL